MIKLSNPGTEYWDSPTTTWPHTVSQKNWDIVHNKGRRPDHIQILIKDGSSWHVHYDIRDGSGTNYQGYIRATNEGANTPNSERILLYYNNIGVTVDVKARLFWFTNNDDQFYD